jgi:hypothetical protein
MKRPLVTGGVGIAASLLVFVSVASAHSGVDLISDGAIDNAKDTHAHDAQHGHEEGHLDPITEGPIEVVSELAMSRVTEGGIADVAVFGDYAYLNSWGGAGNCGRNGTHVVDISDVANPVEVAFINSKEGSYPGEGAQVLSIDTASFTGDVLLTNNELCKDGVGFGGINLYDVTDPTQPENLALGFGDYDDGKNRKKTANQVHSVFAWQDDAKAYAVMVDNEESTDVDIVDITNPRKPKLIAEHDLQELFGVAEGDPRLSEVFLHDMVVKEIDGVQVMLASYWDGGYVLLNVDDPANPMDLADSDFGTVDSLLADGKEVFPEGNAHQAEFTLDNEFVIAADEDFSPYALVAENTSNGTDLSASPGSDTPPLVPGEEISGTAIFAGRACSSTETVAAPETGGPFIAVVERGLCDFTVKVTNVVQAGGYDAILIINRTAPDGCESSLGMTVAGDIPTFGVAPRSEGFAIFDAQYDELACIAGDGTQLAPMALGAVGDTLTFEEYFDGWGFVRLLDADDMSEIGAYAIPESRDSAYASNSGDLSVHEVATSLQDEGLAYLSYYAGGIRVIEVDADTGITEVAAFIDEGGNNFWGIEAFERDGVEYIAAHTLTAVRPFGPRADARPRPEGTGAHHHEQPLVLPQLVQT